MIISERARARVLVFLSPLLVTISRAAACAEELSAAQAIRLPQALSAVPDPRRRGRRHSLHSVLLVAVSAVLAVPGPVPRSSTGLSGPGRRSGCVAGRRPARRSGGSCWGVDPVAVQAALARWALARRDAAAATAGPALLPRNRRRPVPAVDGKNLRGARQHNGRQIKLPAVIDHTHRLVRIQTEVCDGNEIAAVRTALDTLPGLRGCLITADALHTRRGHAEYLIGRATWRAPRPARCSRARPGR